MFGENFPYTNFHDLNMDWIIKIAKDFLDQYTSIQQMIADGETSLQNLTESGLQQLQDKADNLESLLQAWYNEHSEDIANQLADALRDLNAWYTEHSADIANELNSAILAFNASASAKTSELIDSIPEDFSELVAWVNELKHYTSINTINLCKVLETDLGTVANVPITNNYNGTMIVNGTSNDAGIGYITDIITLPAGTYKVGFLPSTGSDLYIQVRDFTGGTDQGNLAQTKTNTSFTVASQTDVKVRFMTEGGKTYNNVLCRPILTLNSNFPLQWIPSLTANDVYSRNKLVTALTQKSEDGIADLNNVLDAGYYFLSAGINYSNLPELITPHTSGALLLKNFAYAMDDDPRPFIVQELWVLSSDYAGIVFTRRNTNGTWQPWVKRSVIECIEKKYFTDLNDAKIAGYYFLVSSYDYPHLPQELQPHTSGALTLRVYAHPDGTFLQQEIYVYSGDFAGSVYQRRFAGNTWYDWYKICDAQALESINRTQLESINPASYNGQGENVGTNIKVMTYNVAHYNHDRATYITNTKIQNLRKFLGKANVDFIMLQEGNKYIDGSGDDSNPNHGTKIAKNYIYYPVYPAIYGENSCMIAGKRNLSTNGWLQYTSGRPLRYGVWTNGNIKLLIISTHPTPGSDATAIATRAEDYEELFKWVKGTITLNTYGGSTPVSVPDWTHCVIGMDANCETDADKTNILNEANSADFIAGNGGALGWFFTWYDTGMSDKYSLDCIFVSDNIIINNIESYGDWYEKLYSDHVPVVAELTLL